MLYLSWGSYVHGLSADGIAGFGIRRDPIEDFALEMVAFEEAWDINGTVFQHDGDIQALRRKLDNLAIAYATPRQDVKLTENGTTETHHILLSSDCLGGTRIIKPLAFPTTRGPQNVSRRDFTVTVGGRVSVASASAIVAYEERISYDGGGAEDDIQVTRNTKGVKIQKTKELPYTAVQEGSATGYGSYPDAAEPLWPEHLMKRTARPITLERGQQIGGVTLNKRITWRYEFKSTDPLIGIPSNW